MKTVEINLYTVDELSDKARERAYNDFLATGMATECLYYERRKTIEKFERLFDISITYNRNHYTIKTDNELSGNRLRKFVINNYYDILYKLKRKSHIFYEKTGCCISGIYWDENLLQPMYEFLEKPYEISYEELIMRCLHSFDKVFDEEVEYRESKESFVDYCNNCNNLFFKNGEQYYGNL